MYNRVKTKENKAIRACSKECKHWKRPTKKEKELTVVATSGRREEKDEVARTRGGFKEKNNAKRDMQIRAMAKRYTQIEVAEYFGISRSRVSQIVRYIVT